MSRITDRLKGLDTIKKIDKEKSKYLVIHYSSESFFALGGKSPRITSIAIENLEFVKRSYSQFINLLKKWEYLLIKLLINITKLRKIC